MNSKNRAPKPKTPNLAKRSIVSLVGASVLLAGITTWFNRDNVGGLIEDVRVLRSPMTDQEEDISALVSKVGAEFGETNPGRPRVKCVGDSISGDPTMNGQVRSSIVGKVMYLQGGVCDGATDPNPTHIGHSSEAAYGVGHETWHFFGNPIEPCATKFSIEAGALAFASMANYSPRLPYSVLDQPRMHMIDHSEAVVRIDPKYDPNLCDQVVSFS